MAAMAKKIALGVVVLLLAAGVYLYLGTKRSPADTVTFKSGALDATVTYCRPYKKERVIFGPASTGALVPDGKYWRLGANQATAIALPNGATFAGQAVAPGTYRMYAVPGPTTWKVVLNSEAGKWGAAEADHSKDVLTVEVPVEKAATALEQFTISFQPEPSQMIFAWDTTLVRVALGPK